MENINTISILKGLLQHWKKLIVVAVIAALVGTTVSFLITPLYKSISVVYPVNLMPNSEESNTEQLLQWFNSENVKQSVAKQFNLYKHYKIDTLDPKHKTWFNLKYKELISFSPTLYESIEITVKDKEPEMAQKINQGLIEATNALIMTNKKEILKEYIKNGEAELAITARQIDSLKNMINSIKKEYNIIDPHYHAKYISKEITAKGTSLSESNTKTAEGIKNYQAELNRLDEVIKGQLAYYVTLRSDIQKYHIDYAHKISFTNIVSTPTLPDTKCYPIRSLIVALFVLSSVLIASLILIFQNTKK